MGFFKAIKFGPWILRGVILLLTLGSLGACGEKPVDYYLVVDVSGSMAEGKVSTMEQVKQSLPGVVKVINPGDRVTIISFADMPVIESRFVIESDDDIKRVSEVVEGLNPSGRYTDMKSMLQTLAEASTDSDMAAYSRQYLIVLSDGIDDPPPGARKNLVNLETYRSEPAGEMGSGERYIYYISLGDQEDTALKEGLSEIASGDQEVKVIKGKSENGEQTGIVAVADDIEKIEQKALLDEYGPYIIKGLAIIGVLLLLLLVLWLLKKLFSGPELSGILLYKEDKAGSFPGEYKLSKVKGDVLTVGSRPGVRMKVKDLGVPGIIKLKSVKRREQTWLKPVGKSEKLIKMLTNAGNRYIEPGDKFKIGNYIFEYKNVRESK